MGVFLIFIIALAETNRRPFDFVEGESELVSGFNVEFAGTGFVVLFLSEYLSIIFISNLVASFLCNGTWELTTAFSLVVAFSFIWTRGTLPRFRYDQLMFLCWKTLLPVTLSSFVLLLCL